MFRVAVSRCALTVYLIVSYRSPLGAAVCVKCGVRDIKSCGVPSLRSARDVVLCHFLSIHGVKTPPYT